MKPYVICHMCTTVDGKIISDRWGKLPGYKGESDLFETTAASFGIGLTQRVPVVVVLGSAALIGLLLR